MLYLDTFVNHQYSKTNTRFNTRNSQGCCYCSRADSTSVPTRDCDKNRMDVGLRICEDRKHPHHPMIADGRQALQSDECGQYPDLAYQSDEETIIDLFTEPGKPKEIENEQDVGGNAEKIGFESPEARSFEVKSQVLLSVSDADRYDRDTYSIPSS